MSEVLSRPVLRGIAAIMGMSVAAVVIVAFTKAHPARSIKSDVHPLLAPTNGWAPKRLAVSDPNGFARVRPLRAIVSSSSLGDGTYLIADYLNVYRFDPKRASLTVVQGFESPPGQVPKPIDKTRTYVPTGVVFDGEANKVYVANYYGNNILEFSLELAQSRMTLEREIVTPNTIGPEAVGLFNDGRYLVSANYDAGNISGFELGSEDQVAFEPKEVWSYAIEYPHGIAIDANKVYVSSLWTGELHVLSLDNGKLRRKIGSKGWEHFDHEWMLPGAIAVADGGAVWVADAKTGFLTHLAPRSLGVRAVHGGNGPGYGLFNMPYQVEIDADAMLVLSTYQQRILVLDAKTLKVRTEWVLANVGWRGEHDDDEHPNTTRLDEYYPVRSGGLRTGLVSLFGVDFQPIYEGLGALGESPVKTLKMPVSPSIFEILGMQYFVFSLEKDGASIVFSPQAQNAYVIFPEGGLSSHKVGFDCWLRDDSMVCAGDELPVAKLIGDSRKAIHTLDSIRRQNGIIPPQALAAHLPGIRADVVLGPPAKWPVFRSEAGRAFASTYARFVEGACGRDEVRVAGSNYFETVRTTAIAFLDEYSLVAMLSGGAPVAEQIH